MKSATRALFLCPEIEMYSPKISEELIPVLYRMAKARGIPMTTLVNELLSKGISEEPDPSSETSIIQEALEEDDSEESAA